VPLEGYRSFLRERNLALCTGERTISPAVIDRDINVHCGAWIAMSCQRTGANEKKSNLLVVQRL